MDVMDSSFGEAMARRMDSIQEAVHGLQERAEAMEGAVSANQWEAFRASLGRDLPEIRRLVKDAAAQMRPAT